MRRPVELDRELGLGLRHVQGEAFWRDMLKVVVPADETQTVRDFRLRPRRPRRLPQVGGLQLRLALQEQASQRAVRRVETEVHGDLVQLRFPFRRARPEEFVYLWHERGEELWGGEVCGGEGPEQVGEVLRVERCIFFQTSVRNRFQQRLRLDARRRVRPSEIRERLRIERKDLILCFDLNCLKHCRRLDAELGKGPDDIRQVVGQKGAEARHHFHLAKCRPNLRKFRPNCSKFKLPRLRKRVARPQGRRSRMPRRATRSHGR
mmetsp:Transcript_17037/g.60603  ORF Transcript_17037/g.60603 Transcript_17037/m.60603 type:complete len:263 (-) Transcript_17037:1337-2125(-)